MSDGETLQETKDRRGTDRRTARKPIAHKDRRVSDRRSGTDRREEPRLEF